MRSAWWSRFRRVVVASVFVPVLAAVGCSDEGTRDAGPTTVRVPDDVAALVSTTTAPVVPGSQRTADDYLAAGATPSQAACLLDARLDRPLDVALAEEPGGPIEVSLAADDGSTVEPLVVLPATVSSAVEVQRALLGALAPDCLPPTVREAVAARLGAEDDAAALAEDLPLELARRRGTGATPEEIECLDAGYRAAPARLVSLAADHRVVDRACISAARLDVMRRAAIGEGLAAAGATEAERSCLLGADDDLAVLADTLALAAGGAGEIPEDGAVRCVSGQRLGELAVTVLAREIDFSGEELVKG